MFEKFENSLNDLRYHTKETLWKAFDSLTEAFLNFADWYNHYEGKSYQILKEIGELIPQILTWLIPELKASKLAKAERALANVATEEVAVGTMSSAEKKAISRTLKEKIETGEGNRGLEKASKETEEEISEKIGIEAGSIFKTPKEWVDDVDSGKINLDEFADGTKIKVGDNRRFSNYAEMKADIFFENNTFIIGENRGTLKRISLDSVKDLDGTIPKGIDGVYEFSNPPPYYVITEVKMNTTGSKTWRPRLDRDVTKSGGSQMTDNWIKHNLKISMSNKIYRDIMVNDYDNVLVEISKDNMILRNLDKTAKIIKNDIKIVN